MQSIARSSCSIRAVSPPFLACVFFFNDTATTEIYTLSLHDALPISPAHLVGAARATRGAQRLENQKMGLGDLLDRKSTRLNSSHGYISYAVFCLKKKKHQGDIWLPTFTAMFAETGADPTRLSIALDA